MIGPNQPSASTLTFLLASPVESNAKYDGSGVKWGLRGTFEDTRNRDGPILELMTVPQ